MRTKKKKSSRPRKIKKKLCRIRQRRILTSLTMKKMVEPGLPKTTSIHIFLEVQELIFSK